ncbi:MAG TPA: protein kinase [Gemmatimonadales bacterium]|nr:protein kinase [Gemmatimonadales bacterium]
MLLRWKRAGPEPLSVGDRYTVERELGRGGMATVYLAGDRKHDRPVAIKVMRPEVAADLGGQRFLLEIQILARLQHPNILALLDSGTTGEASPRPFYVMPFVEGESLRQRLTREGPLPVAEALRLVREIGEALHYAHGQGLIHRDVKPENVLLSQGHALVADFGIARAAGVAGGQQLTQPGLGLGTPAYMSPEQTEGDRGVDARADQYSLACVLYELLAGQPPFTGPTLAAVLSQQLLAPVPPITAFRPGVPAPVRGAIERALSKVPADRFATVMDFLAAVEATEPGVTQEVKQAIVVLPFANLSPDPDNAYFADGLMEEVIADLSRVRALTVISRTSSIKLKETGWELRRIGRELNVRYALEGSVRRAGSALRITAQLIDIESDEHLWAEKYSGTVDDVFDLQERLSRQIVEALRITLTPPEDQEIAKRPIADIRAYEYYQRARQEYYRYTPEGMAAARALAEHGLAVAGPNEALYGMLGTVHAWSAAMLGGTEEANLREAEDCARRAFELSPRSAQGLSIMGQVAYRRGRPGEAVRLLTQACAADPNNPDAMHQLGGAYLLGGRIGPMRETVTRLVELDPLTPSNHCLLGLSWSLGGDAPGALFAHRRAVELDPRSTICRFCAGVALTLAGQPEEAAEQFDWLERQPEEDHLARVAVRFRGGLRGDRAAVLAPLGGAERAVAESDEYWSYLMASSYALVGAEDEAMRWLEHAVGVRGWIDYVYFTQHDRFLRSLRPNRRFQELMASAQERYTRFTNEGALTRQLTEFTAGTRP